MNQPINLKTTNLYVRTSSSRATAGGGFLVVALALAWFALLLAARAVSPAPDGGYPNQNTAEGDNALLNLTSGANNTAVGLTLSQATRLEPKTRPTALLIASRSSYRSLPNGNVSEIKSTPRGSLRGRTS